jgi:L-threonylcarbamoyladenylate synthase
MITAAFEEDIKQCIATMEQGGIFLYPTDTIWGLGCDATDEAAVRKVSALKQRDDAKTMIILLAEAKDVLKYVANPHPDIVDIIKNFDRPTTVVYEGGINLPSNVVREDGTIAIRVTTDLFCKALIKRSRKPIISTSANLSGGPGAPTWPDIVPEIKQGADYAVHYRQDDLGIAAPSAIVRVLENGELDYLRR